ncbi:MAG: hypothetical protein ACI87O_003128 [Planctomycetota bacterium]|jgi:hypothetical protein
MSERYADQGLVIIGVHSKKGGEDMAKVAEKSAIPYPLAIDSSGATVRTYGADSFPDYYLIDRAGNLRVADLANGDLERAVKLLLAEKASDSLHPALATISSKAKKKDKRLLIMWGPTTDVAPIQKLAKTTPGLRKLIYNEYEITHLSQIDNPKLAKAQGIGDGVTLAILDASGKLLQTTSGQDMTGENYMGWLEQHRVPVKDAEVLWSDALKQAKAHNKRILVHLGAPW